MTGTWFCKCRTCGIIYVAPVKTEGGNCPPCEMASIRKKEKQP